MSDDTYFYPVVGRKDSGGIFDRIPIEEMQEKQPHQFTLFILGYLAIQNGDSTVYLVKSLFPDIQVPVTLYTRTIGSATSYMQVAGIHGKPYVEYAGDRKSAVDKASDFNQSDRKDTLPVPSRFGGYCNHGSVSFPTWHRPYVMLVEQAIGEFAVQIAQLIESFCPAEKGIWTTAANQLRFPYWDWADPKVETEGLPPVLYEEMIPVMLVGGKMVPIQNPISFYAYEGPIPPDFQDVDKPNTQQTAYFSKWKRTYRYAESSENPPRSNINELQRSLKDRAANIRKRIGLLFTFDDDRDPSIVWDEFSNQVNESRRKEKDCRNYGSLESVHGSIHGVLGGNGHMSNPDYAAFDPIFFLHHSNVDRIIALWEWCYPGYWMGNGYRFNNVEYPWTQQRGTYAQVYNEQILPSGARGCLPPFRNADGTYWTSEQTRFLHKDAYPKYYSYQEFLGIKVDKPATDARERLDARKRIANHYGANLQADKQLVHSGAWSYCPVAKAPFRNYKSISEFRVFIVLVRLPEHAFNCSYSFNLFYKEELIGDVTVFARADHSPCKACAIRRDSGTIIRGVIPLDASLVDKIIADNVTSEATLYNTITKNLRGKLVDTSGKLLATAIGGDDADEVSDEDATAPEVSPAEIVLLSCAVAEHPNKDHPVCLYDWKSHKDLFPSGWAAMAPEAHSK